MLKSCTQKRIAVDLADADLRFLSSPITRYCAERCPPKSTSSQKIYFVHVLTTLKLGKGPRLVYLYILLITPISMKTKTLDVKGTHSNHLKSIMDFVSTLLIVAVGLTIAGVLLINLGKLFYSFFV